jgi:hypothetical protein
MHFCRREKRIVECFMGLKDRKKHKYKHIKQSWKIQQEACLESPATQGDNPEVY